MKRALRILAALLLFACLTGVALGFTALRPREVAFPVTIENKRIGDTPWRTRIEVKHRWGIPGSFQFRTFGYNQPWVHFQMTGKGWQFGPYTFEEERKSYSWPAAVEKAGRILAVRKLGVKESILRICPNQVLPPLPQTWNVAASGPEGQFFPDGVMNSRGSA